MNRSRRRERKVLSFEAASKLAEIVIPAERWQDLARKRYLDFLGREGLIETDNDDSSLNCEEKFGEWRQRLFAVLAGVLAAAVVIVSLQAIFIARPPAGERQENIVVVRSLDRTLVQTPSIRINRHKSRVPRP